MAMRHGQSGKRYMQVLGRRQKGQGQIGRLIGMVLLGGGCLIIPSLGLVVPAKSIQVAQASQSAEAAINQGLQYIQQGRLDQAIAAFQQATQLNPRLAAAHYNLGLALRQKGQLQASANSFYKATQADPKFALAYANLGAALLEGNNLKQAQDYLQRAIELDPNMGLAHYNLGLVYESQKAYDQAISAYRKAMQLTPNAPEPAYHTGLVYVQQNKLKEARAAFEQALKIAPNYSETNYKSHYNIGSILFRQGDLDGALNAFRRSAEANSNYPNAYYAAGMVFLRQNKFNDAEKVLTFARDLFSKQGDTRWAQKSEEQLQKAKAGQR
ncbi:MAG: tetratricopeptide repeat protein [Kovacikia sp.]